MYNQGIVVEMFDVAKFKTTDFVVCLTKLLQHNFKLLSRNLKQLQKVIQKLQSSESEA